MAESKQLYKQGEPHNSSVQSVDEKYSYIVAKRTLDILFSFLGLVVLIPIFILISLLVKLEDRKGTIFFKQVRVGRNGRKFNMYKFRSMVSDAEDRLKDLLDQNEATGPLFKMKEDPRVTNIGKFLRKTSLDELPQLINVLRGEMSLVGPRPALPREVDKYNIYEMQRLQVNPGLTCLWQVSGRSNLGFEQQIELDLEYINKKNLMLDIVLIFKTIKVLFGSKDAF